MRAVDTNILVRLFMRDDAKQAAIAETYIVRGGWVSTVVVAETSWVLAAVYKLGHEEIATVAEMLLSHQQLSLQDPEVVAAALEQFRESSGVEFADCLILEIARKAGHLPFGTFDRALGKLDGTERL